VDGPYRPEQPLAKLDGGEARGRWTLRIQNAGQTAGTLYCWQLDLSRDVVEVRRGQAGGVTALLSFRESNDLYRDLRLKIVRRGRVALDAPLAAGRFWRPFSKPIVRSLDADQEPEVLVDLYSGGAHCCTISRIFRYRSGRYVPIAHDWGNVGYRLGDPDHDGRPEFVSADDRFAYAFTAYAASLEPVEIWRYDRGRMLDVTRRFPRLIERDAAFLWRLYLRERKARPPEVRGILAAWLADQALLGRAEAGWRALDEAYRRGDLGRGKTMFGYPAGRDYLAALRRFLRKTGYI
jgi:hypothetical protein